RVVLMRESAHPFHPKSLRAGGTAALSLDMRAGPSIHELPASFTDIPLLCLTSEPSAPPIDGEEWPERFGLLAGVEGPGLPASLPSGLQRRIPIAEGVESLNAATAVAIALFAWRNRT